MGKELLSQAIHNESERGGGPYIAVNCQLYADSVLGQDFMGSAPTDDENAALAVLSWPTAGRCFWKKSNTWRRAAVRAAAGDQTGFSPVWMPAA